MIINNNPTPQIPAGKPGSAKQSIPTTYGGQAVMEGVMMRGRRFYAMAVRKPNGELHIEEKHFTPPTEKYPILKLPILRGVTAFVSSFTEGIGTLSKSAEIAGEGLVDDEPPSRFEKFLEEKLGDNLNKVLVNFSVVLAMIIGIGLFMLLPTVIGSSIISFLYAPEEIIEMTDPIMGQPLSEPVVNTNEAHRFAGIIEGFVRIAIFIGYVMLVSRSKDVRRVFEYHGAEHKTINCHEHNEELTIENVSKHTRLHKRCGTSFIFVVMIISMIVFLFVSTDSIPIRLASRVVLLPLIAGLSYEISVKWAGQRDNWLVRAIVFPGMCLQKITTAEPDEKQIETAITALNTVLEKDQPA